MASSKVLLRNTLRLAMLCIAFAGFGCSSEAYLARLKGEWTGQVETVTLNDHAGGKHEAAILRLESGPRFRDQMRFPEGVGAGSHPIFTTYRAHQRRVVHPSELPVGKRVKVHGSMYLDHAIVAEGASQYGAIPAYRKDSKQSVPELILELSKPLDVLE